ncbi:MAG: WYL domain-containing protein [Bacilli bacterium]
MEKIKVNLSYNTFNLLQHDMESFNFEMKDNEPNKNLFYNIVCKEMYRIIKKESESLRNNINDILKDKIKDTTVVNEILNDIEDIYNLNNEDKTNRSHGYYISFRPQQALLSMYEEIENNELRNSTISNYYRNLFNKYAKLPQDERERIIFHDQLKIIESAIDNKKTLLFTNGRNKAEIIPYAVVRTNDELYNYLITGVRQKDNSIRFFSLHLYKCAKIIKTKNRFSLTEDEILKFDEMLEYGPRNIERRNAITKILLTKKGIKIYKKFYLNRPIPETIEGNVYTFNCSVEELFVYFSRFGNDAIILEPIYLRNQMINFHKKGYFNYFNNFNK